MELSVQFLRDTHCQPELTNFPRIYQIHFIDSLECHPGLKGSFLSKLECSDAQKAAVLHRFDFAFPLYWFFDLVALYAFSKAVACTFLQQFHHMQQD